MPRDNNFLLGRGELLTAGVSIQSGGGTKNPPYDLPTARKRIARNLEIARKQFESLPEDARPKDQVVAVVAMHPRYVSKSDFPEALLSEVGLRAVGSRAQRIAPEEWGIKKHPEEATTEAYFIAGERSAFSEWTRQLEVWNERTGLAQQLTHIEQVGAFLARDKVRAVPVDTETALFEIVLHNSHDPEIIKAFYDYVVGREGDPLVAKQRDVRGLTFLPVRGPVSRIQEFADFSFVRVARGMPTLRPLQPKLLRSRSSFSVSIPKVGVVDENVRAVVFDGGLPDAPFLSPWVNYIEPVGVGKPVSAFEDHGLAVTSALLFGTFSSSSPVPQPFCSIDHVRVLDEDSGSTDYEIIDVLDRIEHHLDLHPNKYQFVNISLGPDMSVEDDDVTLWTSSLDERFAAGEVVATVAAGNNGERDAEGGLNRVQVPADGVNVLSVGAADSLGAMWMRAPYSGVGPGRTPGRVKPDLVAFGGSDTEPFYVLGRSGPSQVIEQQGTSFAAPLALRSAAGVRALLGPSVGALSIRALLIHRSDRSENSILEVGWGRPDTDPLSLVTCEDDEALVLYQGTLLVGQHLRAQVPVPSSALTGSVALTATLLIAPNVDPEFPGTYTRSGLEVSFRPHDAKFRRYGNGKQSQHPITVPFFSTKNMYGTAEYQAREDGHKWEPCLKHVESFKASHLSNPVFDIYYHTRVGAAVAPDPAPIPYALVVSLQAPEVPDLYNQVVRNYASILTPLRPVTRIPLKL